MRCDQMPRNSQRDEPEMLPCPFCGGEAGVNTVLLSERHRKQQGWKQALFFGVNCISCGVNNRGSVGFETEAEAVEKWNRRVA